MLPDYKNRPEAAFLLPKLFEMSLEMAQSEVLKERSMDAEEFEHAITYYESQHDADILSLVDKLNDLCTDNGW